MKKQASNDAEVFRDRIKEFRRVKASELIANPHNWRVHPPAQQLALRGLLREIGYADVLITREKEGKLELLDGHLRAETTPESEVPVIVVDLNDAEADKLLLTHDPVGAMAEADREQIDALLKSITTDDGNVRVLLDQIAALGYDVWRREWQGMPEYVQTTKTAYAEIIVRFSDEKNLKKFAKLIDQELTAETNSIWYPKGTSTMVPTDEEKSKVYK